MATKTFDNAYQYASPTGQMDHPASYGGGAYTNDQIASTYNSLLSQGNSNEDILRSAYNLGISPDQIIASAHGSNPDVYSGVPGTTMENYVRSQYAGFDRANAPPPVAGGGGGGPKLNQYQQNPYLAQMGAGLQKQFNDNLTMSTLPALRGGAVAVGGVGGSRQGIAEGLASSQSNAAADNAITNLYGQDYEQSQNRNLQKYGMDQSYNLGLGGLSNQKYGMDQNFYTQQRGLDQSGVALGANLYNQGTQGQWSPIKNANDVYSNYTGFGPSSTSTSAGGGWQGILGGGLGAAQFAKNMGWF